jgi:hypothetical protein
MSATATTSTTLTGLLPGCMLPGSAVAAAAQHRHCCSKRGQHCELDGTVIAFFVPIRK